jgi:hypothetical protein
MSGHGKFILNTQLPDDYGDVYVPFSALPGQGTFGEMHGAFKWPSWLPSRDYFYRGEA